jgi:hypothetical protein
LEIWEGLPQKKDWEHRGANVSDIRSEDLLHPFVISNRSFGYAQDFGGRLKRLPIASTWSAAT